MNGHIRILRESPHVNLEKRKSVNNFLNLNDKCKIIKSESFINIDAYLTHSARSHFKIYVFVSTFRDNYDFYNMFIYTRTYIEV